MSNVPPPPPPGGGFPPTPEPPGGGFTPPPPPSGGFAPPAQGGYAPQGGYTPAGQQMGAAGMPLAGFGARLGALIIDGLFALLQHVVVPKGVAAGRATDTRTRSSRSRAVA